ncbi:MAG: sigma-54-dependent transcriptional regulator [Bdellovibrionales bacterium]
MFKVLVCDDDAGLRLSVASALAATGRFEVDEAFDGVNAVEKIKSKTYNIVLLDVDMPRLTGLEALKIIKEHDPSIIVLILTAYANIDDAVRAVKEGAFNYVSKPIKSEDLVNMVDRAINAFSLISQATASFPMQVEPGREIIGHTSQMKKVFSVIMRLSKVDTPVLIRGASGTGKELVARAIHSNSSFKDGKFVALNCSAIPENLFESELFGHEKGAFTGADQRKIGKFQYAEGGTLFLDEIGDLPVMMQVKLLRVLQEKCFTPVGANREIESNVRIIAATNRPLEEMIKKSTFREDLYYRLNVMPINLPSLSERRADIHHLVNLFVQKFNKAQGKKIIGVSNEGMNVLKKYDWPGNIRELENIIEHAFILEESNMLQVSSLPESILMATGTELSAAEMRAREESLAAGSEAVAELDLQEDHAESDLGEELIKISGENLDFNKHKEAFEREFIIKALKMFKGRINQTALHANIPKKTLLRKIEKYGINARDYAD